MKIVILGTGNTAWVLGKKFRQAGHEILQVYGRNALAAGTLAYEANAKAVSRLDELAAGADVYLLAVSDAAIGPLASQLSTRAVVAHTAGAVSKELLKTASADYGVFYPLQSLRRQLSVLPQIPVAVDGSSPKAKEVLTALAQSISNQVFSAGDEERLKLHLAAVFVNNFTNHLYSLMEKFCREQNIDFCWLLPLIKETAMRLDQLSAFEAQTGPALRHDSSTIHKHLELLKDHEELKAFYQLFTRSIQQMHDSSAP